MKRILGIVASQRMVGNSEILANPTIVSVPRAHRGNTIDLAGKKLKDILPRLKQEVIDIEVEVSFKGRASMAEKNGTFEVYHPRGGTPKVKETFRLVV